MISNEVELQVWWRDICPLFEHIGLIVESARDGVYRCSVPLTQDSANHFNTMHAAIQMAVAEVLGGIVGMTIVPLTDHSRVFGAVRSFSFEFLRPARTSVTAETRFEAAQSEQIRQLLASGTDTEFQLESTVRDESGEIVAKGTAKYVLRPWRGDARHRDAFIKK